MPTKSKTNKLKKKAKTDNITKAVAKEFLSKPGAERKKIQLILDNFIDGLLILDSNKKIGSVNPPAERFLKIHEDDVCGKTLESLSKNGRIKELSKVLEKEKKQVLRKEISFLNGDLVLEVTSKFIFSHREKIAILISLHDMSREKVVERMKSQFVSIAAHQLRTPLSIIKWSLSMLLEGDLGILTKEQKDLIVKTYDTNERMIRLINDLLNVARIEEGRFMYKPKTVDLVEVVDLIIDNARPLAKGKDIDLTFKKPKDESSKIVKADIEKLSLAIKNLVENAIFYTKNGGTVIVSVKRKKDQVVFSVKDNGIGLPKKQWSRIFTKFFRADNAIRMETEGTGLGLFITKNIIEAHGGKIGFKSKENEGTTFTFHLPAIG